MPPSLELTAARLRHLLFPPQDKTQNMRKYEFIRRLRAERSQKVIVAGRKDRFLAKKTIVMTVRSQ